jgi:hypothetical protein
MKNDRTEQNVLRCRWTPYTECRQKEQNDIQ